MKIKFKGIADEEIIKSKLNQVKRQIELLEKTDLKENLEMNEENIKKLVEIQKAYKNIISNDWNVKPIKIIVVNSNGAELTTINN